MSTPTSSAALTTPSAGPTPTNRHPGSPVVRQPRRHRLVAALAGRWRTLPVLATLVAIWVFFSTQAPGFLTARNLSNLSVQIVVTAVLALGLVLVLLIGEIDLSVAALGALASGVMARLMVEAGLPTAAAIAVALLFGVLVGSLQGLIVTQFRAPAFIVTLGASLIMQGVLLQLLPRTGQFPLAGTPIELITGSYLVAGVGYALAIVTPVAVTLLLLQTYRHRTAQGQQLSAVRYIVVPGVACLAVGLVVVSVLNLHRGVPSAVVLMLALLAGLAYLTTQTRLGTYLYAIGGNAEAARRAGIRVRRVKVTTFALTGGLAAIAGIVAASRTLGVSSQSGSGTILLEAVAAAVIGGASLFGGRGSVWAALLGALVIGSISNGLDLLGAEAQTKLIIQGAILILAVAVDGALSKGARAR